MSSNDPYTSLKAATSLLSAVPYDGGSSPSYSTHTDQTVTSTQSAYQIKFALQKLKEGNVYEKSELQRLNQQLQKYLDNVQMLQNMNRTLLLEVEKAKQERPLVVHTENKELYSGVETLRGKLEHEQLETVRNKLRIEDSEKLVYYLGERIKFFESEAARTKSILQARQQELNHIENERQKLLRGAESIEGRIRSEYEQQQNAEQEIDKLRAKLREIRGSNHKMDYEIRTMRDMRSFYEHAFKEELHEYRSKPKGQGNQVLSANDLNKFYKTELDNAIKQIRQDFQQLHEHQMKEYKSYKENELALIAKQIEHDRMIALQTKQRADHNKDLESQSARELQATLEYNRQEMGQLNARYHELTQKLQQLENSYEESRYKKDDRMQQVHAELEQLRYDNDVYAGELDYWERVQRVRLDAEIQAYRSLLNSQFSMLKIQQQQITSGSSNYHTVRPIDFPKPQPQEIPPATTRPAIVEPPLVTSTVRPTDVVTSSTAGPPAVTTASSTVTNNITQTSASSSIVRGASNYDDKTYISDRSDKADNVAVLKQIFDHFDKDKSGKINVSELDKVLTKLNVKLSKESLSKLMIEADRDGNGELTFDEFCRIMLPVFTGSFQDDELRYAFSKFDLDGSGFISVKELKQVLASIGQNFTESKIASMVASVDRDNDGRLSFDEFRRLIKST